MSRTALITGSSRGIGRATADEFAKRNYNVVINYASSKEKAENLSSELEKKYGIKAIAAKADLSKEDEVRSLAEQALGKFGKVDVLVNNAGIALYSEVSEKTSADWALSMQTNLIAPFMLSRILGAEMVKNKYGKIINIASIDAICTYNAQSMEYDASKAALINMT